MNVHHPLPVGTRVAFEIEAASPELGPALGTAVVSAAEYDDGWAYRLDVTGGSRADEHRERNGELWACHFEVRPLPNEAGADAGLSGSA